MEQIEFDLHDVPLFSQFSEEIIRDVLNELEEEKFEKDKIFSTIIVPAL